MRLTLGKLLLATFGVALIAGVIYGFLPRPIDVDFGTATRGHLLISVDEDGKTRIRDKYVVSMPFPGRTERITLDPGDSVEGGESIIATVLPTFPDLLNPRVKAEAEARVRAAQSAVQRAAATVDRAQSEKELAELTVARVRKLYQQKASTEERINDAEGALRARESELHAAEFTSDIARFELEQAQAALIRAEPKVATSAQDLRFEIVSPISGKVLRVFQESAATLATGVPLVELGDPGDLEMEIDVLSQDAVRIRPDARVYIEHWGGDQPLVGRVRLIEPSGFTKISALGVEEQRVNVIAVFTVPAAERATLGDGYRVDARIAVWESDDVLQVPSSSLFRVGADWCVFVIDARNHIHQRRVEVGHRGPQAAQILEGLKEGEQVVLHPSDNLSDGALVSRRPPLKR